jgi:crotonobetainyl-CoA:carnitine CoA-transferase CaiB-like acyl-CoA transferase
LAKTDVLLTSFRPSAIDKLGLGWKKLHSAYPSLCHVAIVGAPGDPATGALLAVARAGGRADLVVAVSAEPASSIVPLLADRVAIGGRPTAYVCRGFTCRLPVTEPAALEAELDAAAAAR